MPRIKFPLALATVAVGALAFAPGALAHPPKCTKARADQAILWPPNHKFHLIHVVGIKDVDGDDFDVTITSVTQDEALDALGDGAFAPDAKLAGGNAVWIRAERSGLGDGRVYQINFTADDHKDGSCSGSVQVGVPHDQGNPKKAKGGRIPRDSGQKFDSLG